MMVFQSKLNCEVLHEELAFEVRWAVAGDSVVVQLVAKLGRQNLPKDRRFMSNISGESMSATLVDDKESIESSSSLKNNSRVGILLSGMNEDTQTFTEEMQSFDIVLGEKLRRNIPRVLTMVVYTLHQSCASGRKSGLLWSEEERRLILTRLDTL
ncbi:hypothetical protein J6590_021052 [Homalodisca vitripennis]|nr:hypothetical protein J6590_021052 [Homalodisca vitripennis]